MIVVSPSDLLVNPLPVGTGVLQTFQYQKMALSKAEHQLCVCLHASVMIQ